MKNKFSRPFMRAILILSPLLVVNAGCASDPQENDQGQEAVFGQNAAAQNTNVASNQFQAGNSSAQGTDPIGGGANGNFAVGNSADPTGASNSVDLNSVPVDSDDILNDSTNIVSNSAQDVLGDNLGAGNQPLDTTSITNGVGGNQSGGQLNSLAPSHLDSAAAVEGSTPPLAENNASILPNNSIGNANASAGAGNGTVHGAVHGAVHWVGYNYRKNDRKLDVQIVTDGSPAYKIFQETNRAGQSELVVRYLNTSLRSKIRRDIDATEFKSPIAYIRMRHDVTFNHTDIVMTMRDHIQPTLVNNGSSLMFTFDIPERWFAPKSEEKPVAAAEIIKNDDNNLTGVSDQLATPGEVSPVAAAYVDNPGEEKFKALSDQTGKKLVPKEGKTNELMPDNNSAPQNQSPTNQGSPRNDQILYNEPSDYEEVFYSIRKVAQGDFSSDIPSSGNSASDLLEDVPSGLAVNEDTSGTAEAPAGSLPSSQAAPSVPAPGSANSKSDVIGINSDSTAGSGTSTKKVMRLDFRDAPVSQIIRMIAGESGINFIISPEAGAKKTSISLKNVPWDVALKAVLESNRMGMQEIAPGLVRIDQLEVFAKDREAQDKALQANEALVPTKVLVMPLNYAKADVAVKLVQEMLPKADGGNDAQRRNFSRFKAQADLRSNSVVVEATPNILSTIKALLERLDTQTAQVRIQSRLVEVSKDLNDGLGITWGAPVALDAGRGLGFGSLPFPNSITGAFSVDPGLAGAQGGSTAFRFGSLNNVIALDLKIRMFEAQRKAETLQTQDVVVQDNEIAKISAGTTDYFSLIGQNSTTLAQVDYLLSMDVTPHITADGAVQMKIDIKGDSPGIAITGSATRKTTRQLMTTMLKRSGETAVIGGLYTSETSRSQRGIPYLSNLPLFGALFRSTEKTDSKKDLLIMVTPTIVGGGAASSAGADAGLMPPINGTGADGFDGNKAAASQQAGGNQATQSQNYGEPMGQSGNASMQSNELE